MLISFSKNCETGFKHAPQKLGKMVTQVFHETSQIKLRLSVETMVMIIIEHIW